MAERSYWPLGLGDLTRRRGDGVSAGPLSVKPGGGWVTLPPAVSVAIAVSVAPVMDGRSRCSAQANPRQLRR